MTVRRASSQAYFLDRWLLFLMFGHEKARGVPAMKPPDALWSAARPAILIGQSGNNLIFL
jgi:hypothetical protein